MGIPDYQTLMRPVLTFHEGGEERKVDDVREAVIDLFELSDADRREMLPSGTAPLLNNRVGWAVTHLAQAGVLERTRRGHTRITERGRELLARHGERLEGADLKLFPEYVAFLNRGEDPEPVRAPTSDGGAETWMLRAGRRGIYAPDFVERSAVILGWGTRATSAAVLATRLLIG